MLEQVAPSAVKLLRAETADIMLKLVNILLIPDVSSRPEKWLRRTNVTKPCHTYKYRQTTQISHISMPHCVESGVEGMGQGDSINREGASSTHLKDTSNKPGGKTIEKSCCLQFDKIQNTLKCSCICLSCCFANCSCWNYKHTKHAV